MMSLTFTLLDSGSARAIEPWFVDPDTARSLGGRDWVHKVLHLMRVMPGFEMDGTTVLARECYIVVEAGQRVALLDLKTSRTHWGPDEIEAGQDQLLLYAAGLRDVIEAVGKPVRLGWWIVGKVKQPWVEIVWLPEPHPAVNRPIKIATIVVEAIEKRLFVPSPSWACATRPYRTACRAWA